MTQSQAMLCALTAFFGWTAVDVFIRLATQATVSPIMILVFMGGVGALSLLIAAAVRRDLAVLLPRSWKMQGLLGLCAIGMNYLTIVGLKNMTLTLFYVMVFTTPLMVAALSAALRVEILTRRKIICVGVGFLGVVVAVDPTGGSGNLVGYAASLGCAAIFALYTVLLRKASATESAQSVQFISAISYFLAGLLFSRLQALPFPEAHAAIMLVVAGVANIASNLFYNFALQGTVSTNVTQLHYSQIVFGGILGYLVWYEVPAWNLWAGAVLIIASGIAVAAEVHRQENAV